MYNLHQPVYVWQLPVRLFHWINALAITVLFITGMYIGKPLFITSGEAVQNFVIGKMRHWHGVFAYIFITNMLFRLYWYWAGNEYSKFRFWKREFWGDLVATLKYYLFMTREHTIRVGHNALAQLSYFIFIWLAGLFMILTGLAMRGGSNPNGIIQALFGWVVLDLGGEYQVRNLHHLVAWGYAIFLLSHLYMVLRQDLLDDDGTVSGIINGYKYLIAKDPSDEKK
ncbi:Ni/Fe-hydrogenase, b-type cytochrome subunit [Desulfosporosinus orientis DSM 765]|uniref:Ni/Fe-hydrogenase, b-type cytochrome subunit n=1 Tax=Desulfosporosinus orientis (strain ATCC 19365 / DSM 765 / NCIMB 8382 / VKM B-1628 / Singapore I) TaxID=768706 RepID=G7WH47_DESOD|nr:Ni/Fe-hydrogenase, b-type cytochrome subunit [Desulfosporosinus orientis]AET69555.1 Ni/Fe-hydrogenase, b-type cytochrome subunit [Desulfosporosinus orientis DSM 765]